jgi:Zn-dependent protease with chaperone function
VLAALVEDIVWAVHAPKPKRIEVDCQVNASAGFGTSFFGMFSNNLTLTIGLPLVVGLSGRQFAGVLAHEFGHFSQGAGMRLSFVVRSINAWFARVVYERDAWDEELRDWCQDSSIWSLVAVMVRVGVGITRCILWVLMVIAHCLSSFLLRKMEYDADRSEVRLVGIQTFEKTFRRIALMSAAEVEAKEIIEGCWMKDRYPDDYATLVVGLADTLPKRDREDVEDELEEATTGIFDSHPSFRDRLASAEKEDPDGVCSLRMPALDLFQNYEKLTSAASITHYKSMFGWGLKPSLRPVAEYLRGR